MITADIIPKVGELVGGPYDGYRFEIQHNTPIDAGKYIHARPRGWAGKVVEHICRGVEDGRYVIYYDFAKSYTEEAAQ